MEHRLVTGIEKALGWDGPGALGTGFARGRIEDPGLTQRLMTPHRLLDTVMRRPLTNPQLRCYAEGREVLPSAYLSDVVTRRRQSTRRADMAGLGAILNAAGTMVLDSVDSFDQTLEVACRALGWWCGELVSVNAYLAVGDTAGFHLHWDDHDVIAIQISGEKSWEVRGASRPVPMYRDAERNLTPSEEVLWSGTMRAGDVMHIPRGFWHTATRIGSGSAGHSLHLTFGVTRRTGVTWINALSDAARADQIFRTDLETTGDQDAHSGRLLSALADLARDHDPHRYLADLRANTPPARHVPYIPVFGPIEAAVAVTEFEPVITVEEAGVQVVGGEKRLTFATRAEPGVRALLSGHPVYLAGADQDIKDVAELLIQEGLCAPLTGESSSGYTDLVTPVIFSKELSPAG